jgi:O-antigen/teichoic acid export membrane protein
VARWRRLYRRKLGDVGGKVSAGVLDAAISSASGFVLSFAALQLLGIEELGVYAVFFSAYSLAMGVPTELAFTPAEIRAIGYHERERVAVLKSSLKAGGLVALVGAALTLLSIPVTLGEIPTSGVFALAVTTFVAAVFGPIEEHIRKVLHVAGRAERAVSASVVMLVAAIVGVVVLGAMPIPAIWVPMSALAFANLASIGAGLLASRRFLIFWIPPEDLKLRELLKVGRWTVIVGFVPSLTAFLVAAIVTALAGAEWLGYAEAGRVVAQPVFVLGIGLLRVLGPRSMEAGRGRDRAAAHRNAKIFRAIMVGGTLAYLAVVAFPWALNPFTYLAEDAYTIPGLVALVVVANLFIGLGFPERSELYGAGREKKVASYEIVATVVTLAAAATAGVTLAFARPISRLVGWAYRVVAYRSAAATIYAEEAAEEPAAVV